MSAFAHLKIITTGCYSFKHNTIICWRSYNCLTGVRSIWQNYGGFKMEQITNNNNLVVWKSRPKNKDALSNWEYFCIFF